MKYINLAERSYFGDNVHCIILCIKDFPNEDLRILVNCGTEHCETQTNWLLLFPVKKTHVDESHSLSAVEIFCKKHKLKYKVKRSITNKWKFQDNVSVYYNVDVEIIIPEHKHINILNEYAKELEIRRLNKQNEKLKEFKDKAGNHYHLLKNSQVYQIVSNDFNKIFAAWIEECINLQKKEISCSLECSMMKIRFGNQFYIFCEHGFQNLDSPAKINALYALLIEQFIELIKNNKNIKSYHWECLSYDGCFEGINITIKSQFTDEFKSW